MTTSNSFMGNKIRAFSFQSPDMVYDFLDGENIYVPNPHMCREPRDYSKDIEQLGGKHPIWCFANTESEFTLKDFTDTNLMDRFRSEMSLGQYGLSRFVMMELLIEKDRLYTGLTHNAYQHAKVFSELRRNDIVALHYVGYPNHWSLPCVFKLKDLTGESIFGNVTDLYEIHKKRKQEEKLARGKAVRDN